MQWLEIIVLSFVVGYMDRAFRQGSEVSLLTLHNAGASTGWLCQGGEESAGMAPLVLEDPRWSHSQMGALVLTFM